MGCCLWWWKIWFWCLLNDGETKVVYDAVDFDLLGCRHLQVILLVFVWCFCWWSVTSYIIPWWRKWVMTIVIMMMSRISVWLWDVLAVSLSPEFNEKSHRAWSWSLMGWGMLGRCALRVRRLSDQLVPPEMALISLRDGLPGAFPVGKAHQIRFEHRSRWCIDSVLPRVTIG